MNIPFLKFPTSAVIARFLRALTGAQAAAEIGVPTTDEFNTELATKLSRMPSGRTLTTNSVVEATDWGTTISLAGFQLGAGATSDGNVLAVSGPGSCVTTNQGTITLFTGERALIIGLSTGDLEVTGTARLRNNIRTTGFTAHTPAIEGDEWFNLNDRRQYVYSEDLWIEQPSTVGLTGYLYADGTQITVGTPGTFLATPETLALRGQEGQIQAAGVTISALTGTHTADSSSADMAGVLGQSNAPAADGLRGIYTGTTGYAVRGTTTNGLAGVAGQSTNGQGVIGQSVNSTGGQFFSTAGTYHALFGETTGNNRLAVERVRGWLSWFYTFDSVVRVGRLKTANITTDREWTLPDQSGTLTLNGHTHIWDDISNKPLTFPPSVHGSEHHLGGTDPISAVAIGAATAAQGALADSAMQPGDPPTAHTHVSTDVPDASNSSVSGRLVKWNDVVLVSGSLFDDLGDPLTYASELPPLGVVPYAWANDDLIFQLDALNSRWLLLAQLVPGSWVGNNGTATSADDLTTITWATLEGSTATGTPEIIRYDLSDLRMPGATPGRFFATTDQQDGVVRSVSGLTISGLTTISTLSTWSYADLTAKDAHLDALGIGAAGLNVFRADTQGDMTAAVGGFEVFGSATQGATADAAALHTNGHQSLRLLREQLECGLSADIVAVGDSTGDGDRWPRRLAGQLAAAYPTYQVDVYDVTEDNTKAWVKTVVQAASATPRAQHWIPDNTLHNVVPAWSTGTYAAGSFVTYRGGIYFSPVDGNADTPGLGTLWVNPSYEFNPPVWSAGTYLENDYVKHLSKRWRSKTGGNTETPGSGLKWEDKGADSVAIVNGPVVASMEDCPWLSGDGTTTSTSPFEIELDMDLTYLADQTVIWSASQQSPFSYLKGAINIYQWNKLFQLAWTATPGSATLTTSAYTGAPVVADGTRIRLRVSMVPDNGTGNCIVTFTYATWNGSVWSAFSPVPSGIKTLAVTQWTKPWGVMTLFGGLGGPTGSPSKYYGVTIRRSAGGVVDFDLPIDGYSGYGLRVPCLAGSPVLNVWNYSWVGQELEAFVGDQPLTGGTYVSYNDDFTPRNTVVFFLNAGHNANAISNGPQEAVRTRRLATTVAARFPRANFIPMSQNPGTDARANGVPGQYLDYSSYEPYKRAKASHIQAEAVRQRWGYIDINRVFTLSGADALSTDGLHPNSPGNDLWAGVIFNLIHT